MRLTVLMDNNTFIDRYFLAEPALSFFIESEGKRILFDAGYSRAFIDNALSMGIDLTRLDDIVISHSHLDHTWGLAPLFRLQTEAALEGRGGTRPQFVAHPDVFLSRDDGEGNEIGSLLTAERVERFCELRLSADPVWLTERLVFLGHIPRNNDFECLSPVGRVKTPAGFKDCYVTEDSALAYAAQEGLVVITGCSHAGVCNIIEHARRVTGAERVLEVIGGMHLLDPQRSQMQGTLDYILGLGLRRLYVCHCTDLDSKIELSSVAPMGEAGVGLVLEYE